MKIRNLILPAIAVGTAVVFTTPKESHGFALLGHELSVSETNFRIENDFLDATANNNGAIHPNWPGYNGAILAIWKGIMEWGSEFHGDGTGDPHQPTGLGSGNSNFDPFFTGEATGTGSIGNNIHSSLDQDGGGTLAFMQGGSFGWWVRYFENHTWSDGPGSIPFGQEDLQGVACHEHGHSLGLDHSTSGGATMTAFASGIVDRSIALDDQLGIQAIYGHKNDSGIKPKITSITNFGGAIEITGENFTDNNNQVWFTRDNPTSPTPTSNEEPIKVFSVSATNSGTTINVTIPAGAGPGDVMVKRNSPGQSSTSNAFPLDPAAVSPPMPTITGVSPSIVPCLTTTGGADVTLTGTGFLSATDLVINGKTVGGNGAWEGDWTIVDDTQIDLEMPLGGDAGLVDIDLTTAGGMVSSSIEIVPPTKTPGQEGILAIDEYNGQWDISDGFDFGAAGDDEEIHVLFMAVADGPSGDPATVEMETGNNDPANFFFVWVWNIGPKFWRQLNVPSFTTSEVPPGFPLWFETIVQHPGPLMDYNDLPWGSSNAVMVTTVE